LILVLIMHIEFACYLLICFLDILDKDRKAPGRNVEFYLLNKLPDMVKIWISYLLFLLAGDWNYPY